MNIEIKEVKDEETGEVKECVLLVGDLKFHCYSQKEAKHLEMMLLLEKNREIFEMLQQQWDEDILKILQKQHLIFKAMILAMLEMDVVWSNGMAAGLIWVAVDFCEGLHNAIHHPQPLQAQAPGM